MSTTSTLASLLAAGSLALLTSCVPSIPLCDCASETGSVPFPDMDLLDRSVDCIENEDPTCGYPAGPYGPTLGMVFDNLVIQDCEDKLVEIADFLQARPDTGKLNRGIVLALGAGWCGPCKDESEHFANELVDLYRPDDIEFIHLIIEGNFAGSEPANAAICTGWRDDIADNKYPILYTPDITLQTQILPSNTAIPVLYMLDANAHVRFTASGTLTDGQLDVAIQAMINDPYGN